MRPTPARCFVTLVALLAAAGGCQTPPSARARTPDGGPPDALGAPDGASPDGPSLSTTAALRLIAPLSTATVTSKKPTLSWALDATCDGAHVQICRDRACTKTVTAFDATGGNGVPATPLPSGVLFWRAYGRAGSTIVGGWSPTWQFIVGTRSAPVDTSWGTTLDVNGDGFADVAVGAAGDGAGGQVDVYLGGPSGLPTVPDLTLSAPSKNTLLGLFLASAGDVNGDGYADLVVGALTSAYLYLGGPSGLAAAPAAILTPKSTEQTGVRVASAGDVNGDGYADVLLGYYDFGTAYLYLGSATGLALSPALALTAPSGPVQLGSPGSGFGHSLAGAGDLNGDGYGDIVIAAPNVNTNGQAYVYLGSASGPPATPSFALNESDGPRFDSVSTAGDVNGDGYADLIVGAYGLSGQTPGDVAGRAYVYLGGAAGPATSPAFTLIGAQPMGDFGRWVSQAGDVDGDGYADVIVGADAEYGNGDTAPGWAYLYRGGPAGLSPTAAATLTGPDGIGSWFGRSVAGAGDVNGDGYADVVVGAEANGSGGAGWAYVYLGGAPGLATSPAVRWVGPNNGSAFGRTVASVVLVRIGPVSL
jgi:hypothetical protein